MIEVRVGTGDCAGRGRKFMLICTAGEVGITPVPVIETLSGLEAAFVVKRKVSVREPRMRGVNFTETEQLTLAASAEPQVVFEMA